MKPGLRIAFAIALMLVIPGSLSAQTPAQVGDVFAGTCDGIQGNTQRDETDVFTPQGQFRNAFNGPGQNSCLTGMTFDANDNLHIISAYFGTPNWDVLEFDGLGNLMASVGPLNSPTAIVHDQQGNFYLAAGSILGIDPDGNTSTYAVAGGAQWITLAADQQTVVYSAANGDVKSFDVATGTQGPDLAVNALARTVRMLPDHSILTDSLGAVELWVPKCATCYPYKRKIAYQIPANADSMALDPDGVSFWTINTYYDKVNQQGHADVYRTNIKTGLPMTSFSLPALDNGRYYSGSIGIDGDGMNSSASFSPALSFAAQAAGTTSAAKTASIQNTGAAEMIASNFAITGDFAIKKNGCQSGIQPGTSCKISVTFSPTAAGPRTGALTVYDNANNSPQTIALSGTGQGATSTALSSSLNPSTYGQTVVLTAQITGSGPNPPTGTVTFASLAQTLGKVTLSGGVATLAVSNLPAGTDSIVANYNGDGQNLKSTSPVLVQSVSSAATTTTVVSARNPSHQGQAVKFTATVQSPTVTPTGSVTFTAGTVNLGTVNLASGTASVTTSSLPAGTTTVTATYNGTPNLDGSSGSVVQTVQ